MLASTKTRPRMRFLRIRRCWCRVLSMATTCASLPMDKQALVRLLQFKALMSSQVSYHVPSRSCSVSRISMRPIMAWRSTWSAMYLSSTLTDCTISYMCLKKMDKAKSHVLRSWRIHSQIWTRSIMCNSASFIHLMRPVRSMSLAQGSVRLAVQRWTKTHLDRTLSSQSS